MRNKLLLKGLLIFAVCTISILAFARQEKVIKIFSKGSVIAEYNAENIDYIQVDDLIGAPEGVSATVEGSEITISWNAVEGATYSIYRSPDNVNFSQLAAGIKETKYTDKSPLKGSNYYRIKATIDGKDSGYTASVTATLTDNDMESGVYLGIYGFNTNLYPYPVMRLDETSITGFYNFIDELSTSGMTKLYYAVEQALNTMQSTQYPSDLSQVAIITFTDGLDRGSHNHNDKYLDSEDGDLDYRNDLNKRIKTQTVSGKEISAYSIGIKGSDVVDYAKFKDNIQKLASAPENAYEVNNMTEVNAKFKEIAEQLNKRTNVQSFNVKIPVEANGSRIRFTFDNSKSNAENSKVWIEGKLNLRTNGLEEITYKGMKFSSPVTSVSGTRDAEGYISFNFTGIVTDDGFIFTPAATMEHIYVASTGKYQPNSEFGKEGDFVPKVDRSSAAIMLVLDCSSSLDNEFKTSQANAKNFIKTLYDASGNEPVSPPSYGSDETFTVNGVTFKMIKVNGGTYMMGSNEGYDSDEKPVHSEIIYDFSIGETEVTQGLWRAVMGSNPSYFTDNDNRPVESVSWEDCQTFISKLNDLTGKSFRLPTEAEWEYAARGGEMSKGYTYSGSDNINDVAWYYGNSSIKTHPVGQKQPNELGIYDMSGNVWEWTSDWYSSNYSSSRNSSYRVNRGGSWLSNASDCRVALRFYYAPGSRFNSLGLRLAL